MKFRIGERVKHRKFVGTIVEIDDISARVFVEEQGNTCWVELDELASIDALQAELAAALARAQAAEAKNEKLQAIILDMDQARRWGGFNVSDDAMDAFRRLESRIKAAMKLIS